MLTRKLKKKRGRRNALATRIQTPDTSDLDRVRQQCYNHYTTETSQLAKFTLYTPILYCTHGGWHWHEVRVR